MEGDTVAIRWGRTGGAISCKVVDAREGLGETKNGQRVFFDRADVIWVLGNNGKWPNFIRFRGEDSRNDTRIKG